MIGGDNMMQRGLEGEDIAVWYLEKKGYTIEKRNYHSRYGEIDIIARDPDDVLVFCEVKRFKKNSMISPEEAVMGTRKYEKMERTIEDYLSKFYEEDDPEIRIELVVVGEKLVKKHITI
jgi:putative endonuclease